MKGFLQPAKANVERPLCYPFMFSLQVLIAREEESGRFRGSRGFLGLPLRTEIRIPAPEGVLPLFVEHPSSYLQEKMCSTLAPSHLLFLHHPFAHDLIDCRLADSTNPEAIFSPLRNTILPGTSHSIRGNCP